ncbi:MAG TPA: hypothetical protein VI485_27190 [Vicinamibacterales bacterium]|nr:hypothetical protein [Vicinamibacterales bacterium]
MEGPFSSLESAYQYVKLLGQQVQEVKTSIVDDIAEASAGGGRRLDALRIVDLKLTQLDQHLVASGRILNDLKVLRRLLLQERTGVTIAEVEAPTPREAQYEQV